MLELLNQLTTKYCPCSIDFISKWNLFVIGTYELNENANESINKRFGSFVLVQDDKLILEYDCNNGGVFDFRISQDSISLKQKASKECNKEKCIGNCSKDLEDYIDISNTKFNESNLVKLYAAHSNGNLSIFEIIKFDNEFKINEINSILTGSNMLTCLDLIEFNFNDFLIVGDSCSTLIIIENEQIVNRIRIDKFDYPIWSIKILNLDFICDKGEIVFLSGSDDCVLRCFVLKNKFQEHCQLFKDDSFEGGVTSIEYVKLINYSKNNVNSEDNKSISETIAQIDCSIDKSQKCEEKFKKLMLNCDEDELIDSEKKRDYILKTKYNKTLNQKSNLKLFVGSYDEKLRIYNLDLHSINNRKVKSPIELIQKISIDNAGIWKIKYHHLPISKSSNDFYLLTGMYSGIHLIKDDKLVYTFNNLPSTKESIEKKETDNEHLIYGCCFNENFQKILITSFYKRKIYSYKFDIQIIVDDHPDDSKFTKKESNDD